jgi:hypothetical protein
VRLRTHVAAVALLACLLAPTAAPADQTLTVRADLSPGRVSFGDPFTYTVEAAGPETLQVFADTGVLTALEPARTSRRQADGRTVVRVTQRLACLDAGCVPYDGAREIKLPPARAVAANGAGENLVARTRPATVEVLPRVPASVVEGERDAYLKETDLPAPTLAVKPGRLAAFAGAAALALGILALALLLLELRRHRLRSRAGVARDELRRAIRLLRESASRPVPDRRRAADLVARVLLDRGAEPLADEALGVAWSRTRPQAADAESLAARADSSARETT